MTFCPEHAIHCHQHLNWISAVICVLWLTAKVHLNLALSNVQLYSQVVLTYTVIRGKVHQPAADHLHLGTNCKMGDATQKGP